jgi:hypothetical protein
MPALYDASVPVFLHYLGRARLILARCAETPERLEARLAPDMFSAAQQFASAAGFALRGSYPLIGQPVPAFPPAAMDAPGLAGRIDFAEAALKALSPEDFAGAEARQVSHIAGFADLTQGAAEYLHRFAVPNFFFHLSMGFAVLRQSGLEIGKADFDGQHDYPPGFRF